MNKQSPINAWSGKFGDEYTARNLSNVKKDDYTEKYGISRVDMNMQFLTDVPKNAKILEVGCNAGQQLIRLSEMGFTDLYGVEPNEKAMKKAKKNLPNAEIKLGDGSKLREQTESLDMVFTSGVLMHIPEPQLTVVMSEIIRVSNRWFWLFEYWAPMRTEIVYRSNEGMLWRDDWATTYQILAAREGVKLELVREEFYMFKKDDEKLSTMALLEKR